MQVGKTLVSFGNKHPGQGGRRGQNNKWRKHKQEQRRRQKGADFCSENIKQKGTVSDGLALLEKWKKRK